MTTRFQTWDRLPLFADEEAVSGALFGAGKTAHWRQIAPLLERRGFPTVDAVMGGRYVPAVKAFFDREYKVAAPHQVATRDGPEDWNTPWKKTKGDRPDSGSVASGPTGAPAKRPSPPATRSNQ
jgi:hypothetical protein